MATTWTPAIELDLNTTSASAFQDATKRFGEWAETMAPTLAPLTITSGWYDITPEMAEDLLRRNARNRKLGLQTVVKYYNAMRIGEWKRTGQPILINQDGKVEDAQHRLWAAYLGKVAFPSFIVTDVPVSPDLFAYIDDNKPRSAADALYTTGNNGMSSVIAATIRLAWRYENHAIGILKSPRIRDMTNIEILDYARNNLVVGDAVHTVVGSYGEAAKVIGNKAVASLFFWKAAASHGSDLVDGFLRSLGSGALLAEDSPILALRKRLLGENGRAGEEMRTTHRLALLIKGFLLHVNGTKVGKRGLSLRDNEDFPRLEAAEPVDLAA